MKRLLFLFAFASLFYSCETCKEASSGPPLFRIEIINSLGENVFTNGTYNSSQLQVTSSNITSFDYSFISDGDFNVIQISPAWQEGIYVTYINLNNEIEIPITTYITKSSGKCYDSYGIASMNIKGYESFRDPSSGIIKIKI